MTWYRQPVVQGKDQLSISHMSGQISSHDVMVLLWKGAWKWGGRGGCHLVTLVLGGEEMGRDQSNSSLTRTVCGYVWVSSRGYRNLSVDFMVPQGRLLKPRTKLNCCVCSHFLMWLFRYKTWCPRPFLSYFLSAPLETAAACCISPGVSALWKPAVLRSLSESSGLCGSAVYKFPFISSIYWEACSAEVRVLPSHSFWLIASFNLWLNLGVPDVGFHLTFPTYRARRKNT